MNLDDLAAFVTADGVRILTMDEVQDLPLIELPGSWELDIRGRPTLYCEEFGTGQLYPVLRLPEGMQ